MTLSILEGKRRVHSAYKIFHKSLTKNTLSYPDRLIVYRSGNYKGTAYWNQASGYWGMYIPLPDDDLYWCNFGLANPVDNRYTSHNCPNYLIRKWDRSSLWRVVYKGCQG